MPPKGPSPKPGPKPGPKPIYKSATIIPYHFIGDGYIFLLAHERDGDHTGALGGGMEKSDRNSPWINACRELGEELYDYKDKRLQQFIQRTKQRARYNRLIFPFPKKKHMMFFCQWERINPNLTPKQIKKYFHPNIELKDIHWVRARDLWEAIGNIDPSRIYGKRAQDVWVQTYRDIPDKHRRIRLRPCFVETCYQFYLQHINNPAS